MTFEYVFGFILGILFSVMLVMFVMGPIANMPLYWKCEMKKNFVVCENPNNPGILTCNNDMSHPRYSEDHYSSTDKGG